MVKLILRFQTDDKGRPERGWLRMGMSSRYGEDPPGYGDLQWNTGSA